MNDPLDAVLDQYLDRALRGEAPDLNDFLDGYPELGDPDKERLAALGKALSTGEGEGIDFDTLFAPQTGLPRERVGNFRLIRRLGEGAMGIVYLAEQATLRRLVALKVIRPEHVGSKRAEARFVREARAAARLRHPHLVQIHEAGEDAGLRYLVMELVPGLGLDELLFHSWEDSKPPSVRQVLTWGRDLARALASAHAEGITHRDVKPSNVRVTPDGRAMLLDFGLAGDVQASMALTEPGSFRGSPYYASPEQVSGGKSAIDERTDIYSLAVTLYECLTGKVPFDADTTEQLFQKILRNPPPVPRRLEARLPRDVETVLFKALEKRPQQRYATMRDFADDLEAVLENRPTRARPIRAPGRLLRWAQRHPAAATASALAFLILVGGPLSYALVQAGHNRELKRSNQTLRGALLTSEAFLRMSDDPTLALLLAIEGARLKPGRSANEALYRALVACREERVTKVSDRPLRSLASCAEGRRMMAGDELGRIYSWTEGGEIALLSEDAHAAAVFDCEVAPNAKVAASVDMDGVLCLWDLEQGVRTHRLHGDWGGLTNVAIDGNGDWVMAGCEDGRARIWDVRSGEPVTAVGDGDKPLVWAGFHSDGIRLILIPSGSRPEAWEIESESKLGEFGELFAPPGVFAFGPSAEQVAARCQVKWLEWTHERAPKAKHRVRCGRPITEFCYSPFGDQMAAACEDGIIRIWNAVSGELEFELSGHVGPVFTLRYSADGKYLISAGADGTVRKWRTSGGIGVQPIFEGKHAIIMFHVDPKRERALALQLMNPEGAILFGLEQSEILTRLTDSSPPLALSPFSSGKDWVGVGYEDRTIRVWDLESMEPVKELHGSTVFRSTEVGPHGRRLLEVGRKGAATLWDLVNEIAIASFGEDESLHGAFFDPDGHCVTLGRDGEIKVYDGDTGEPIRELDSLGEGNRATTLKFSSDRRRMLSFGVDEQAELWDYEEGRILHRLEQHDDRVVRGDFSPDARHVVTTARDGIAKLWRVGDGELHHACLGHEGTIYGIGFSPDSRILATGGVDKAVRLWDVETGEQLATLRAHTAAVIETRFSPDGRWLYTAGHDGKIIRWPMEPLSVAELVRPRVMTEAERNQYREWMDPGAASARD